MGVFQVFKIVQIVPNCAEHHVSMWSKSPIFDLRPSPPNHVNYSIKLLLINRLLVGQVLWPNLWFKRYIQSTFCADTHHVWTSFEVERTVWNIEKWNISTTQHDFSIKKRILKLLLKDLIFRSFYFLAEVISTLNIQVEPGISRAVGIPYRFWLPFSINRVLSLTKLRK